MSAVDYLREQEWSMGNGQCPSCGGVPESWYPHPLHLTPNSIGHKHECRLANGIKELGGRPLFMGDFKTDKLYETGWNEEGFYCTRPLGSPKTESDIRMEAHYREVWDKFSKFVFDSLTTKPL